MERKRSEQTTNPQEEAKGDLLCGITAWHIRMLTENVFEGGGGYTANEVGDMTLDQIFMRLVDKKVLESKATGKGVEATGSNAKAAGMKTDEEGMIVGRAADGTPIRGRIAGESLARRLTREKKEKEERRRQEGE